MRHEYQLVVRNLRSLIPDEAGKVLDRFVSESKRLLDDGPVNFARLDSPQGRLVLVESDDRDLAQLARLFHRIKDLRWIVGPQSHHAFQMGVPVDRCLGILLGPAMIVVVGADSENRILARLDWEPIGIGPATARAAAAWQGRKKETDDAEQAANGDAHGWNYQREDQVGRGELANRQTRGNRFATRRW